MKYCIISLIGAGILVFSTVSFGCDSKCQLIKEWDCHEGCLKSRWNTVVRYMSYLAYWDPNNHQTEMQFIKAVNRYYSSGYYNKEEMISDYQQEVGMVNEVKREGCDSKCKLMREWERGERVGRSIPIGKCDKQCQVKRWKLFIDMVSKIAYWDPNNHQAETLFIKAVNMWSNSDFEVPENSNIIMVTRLSNKEDQEIASRWGDGERVDNVNRYIPWPATAPGIDIDMEWWHQDYYENYEVNSLTGQRETSIKWLDSVDKHSGKEEEKTEHQQLNKEGFSFSSSSFGEVKTTTNECLGLEVHRLGFEKNLATGGVIPAVTAYHIVNNCPYRVQIYNVFCDGYSQKQQEFSRMYRLMMHGEYLVAFVPREIPGWFRTDQCGWHNGGPHIAGEVTVEWGEYTECKPHSDGPGWGDSRDCYRGKEFQGGGQPRRISRYYRTVRTYWKE